MSESEEEYVVEKILSSREDEVGRKQYLVKWEGWVDPTWELAKQFDQDHKNLVDEYR